MAFGERFINLTEPGSPGAPGPDRQWLSNDEGSDAGAGIRGAIRYLLGMPAERDARRGGILYLPPRRYRIDRFTTPRSPGTDFEGPFEDLLIPPEITLWFAPGAFLDAASDNSTVNIQGSINANELMIFATAETQRNDDRLMSGWNQARLVQGRVYLTSLRIPEVFPEWWGAGTQPLEARRRDAMITRVAQALIDTAALQACFNAAHNDRHWNPLSPTHFDVARPTIPVRLIASYQLAAPLFLGVPPGRLHARNPEGFILRGNAPRGGVGVGQPTFLWSNEFDFPADVYPSPTLGARPQERFPAMLVSRGCFGSVLEELKFDASTGAELRRARRCVLLDTQPALVPMRRGPALGHPPAHLTVFRRCSFVNASQALVQVGPPLPPASEASLWTAFPRVLTQDEHGIVSGAHDLSNTSFEQCRFSMGGVSFGETVASTDPRLGADGVVLRAKESFAVGFRDCWFSGPARAAIRAFGGFFLVEGCAFHTLRVCQGNRPLGRRDGKGTAQEVLVGNGADIFLNLPPQEQFPAGEGKGVPVETAGFTAVHVESQSFTFLDMHEGINGAGVNRPVTLLNVRHSTVLQDRPSPTNPAVREFEPIAGDEWPPAVRWHGNGRGVPLSLTGCLFVKPVPAAGTRVLLEAGTLTGSVLSVGTRDEQGRINIFGVSPSTGLVVANLVRQLERTVQVPGRF
ncbi:MAG: hypothetical protein HY909_17255 [Deltaproteobacteria bacterium]|nr:hypothetical protein [Deltaproteobacteria bacterium]